MFVDALELRDLGFDGVDPALTARAFAMRGTVKRLLGRSEESLAGRATYLNPGDMFLHGVVLAPPGGRIMGMWVDGKRAPVSPVTYGGRQMARFPRILPPGATSVVATSKMPSIFWRLKNMPSSFSPPGSPPIPKCPGNGSALT